MDTVYLEFKSYLERRAFIRAVWLRIIHLHEVRSFDMCRPYNLLLKAAYSNSPSICLFGGLYDCAKFALSHSEENQELCSAMLDRIK